MHSDWLEDDSRLRQARKLSTAGASFTERTLRLLIAINLIGAVSTIFCAGAMWARMQAADVMLQNARALHEQAVEDERQSRQILQRLQGKPQSNHGSRDAGQMSSL